MNNTNWMDDGDCRQTNLDFFSIEATEEMYNICKNCPVNKSCFNHAIRYESFGFWAGTTEKERFKIRKKLNLEEPRYLPSTSLGRTPTKNKTKVKNIEHGTERGYQLHIKRRQPFLDENNLFCGCKEAHKEFIRNYRLNRKRTA